jgi:ribonuclease J
MGVDPDKVLICEDGDQLVLTDDGIQRVERAVPAGYLYVDGIVGDVGRGVLRDRRVLAEEGVVVVVITIDMSGKAVIAGPEIITRGWVHAQEAEDLLDECAAVVRSEIDGVLRQPGAVELETLQRHARRAAGKFVNERTRRKPMIVPVVLEA